MKIYPLFDKQLVQKLGQHCFSHVKGASEKYELEDDFIYMAAEHEEKIIAIFPIRSMNKVLVEVHCMVMPEYWGKGISEEAANTGFEWLRQNTRFKKMITNAPDVCVLSIHFIERLGFKMCGSVKNGVGWGNQLRTLFLFERDL